MIELNAELAQEFWSNPVIESVFAEAEGRGWDMEVTRLQTWRADWSGLHLKKPLRKSKESDNDRYDFVHIPDYQPNTTLMGQTDKVKNEILKAFAR